MELIIVICIFLVLFSIIIYTFILKANKNENQFIDINNTQKTKIYFKKKYFMTQNELNFYNILKDLETEYNIIPQLCLGTVIEKQAKNRNDLNKYVDYAIFTKDYKDLLLLIELNDSSHKEYKRIKRDKRVKSICDEAGIKLITFYTNKPNEKEYVISRIRNTIKE